ncbi:hypothetical protein ABZ619_39225 [Streptomyces sp. NPDC007851]|uniref:hypothetical protein n=1 Tax=Streptomyces sp. NPDC007851 TaxID=3155008 RepID=UPI0033D017ED
MSRRSQPRAWLRALERAVEAGLLPGFTATTQAIIEVIASRMCFDTGHARYVMKDVMERTGLGRTAVTDHVKMLRSYGWLAWAEHGSLRNALARLGVKGYARTATVYAATIPPEFDALVGNIVVGTGYNAQVIVDHRPKTPVDTAGKGSVENSGSSESRTPSLWVDKEVGQVQVVGGEDSSTGQARTAHKSPRRKRKLTVTGYKITADRIERARQLAKTVRPLVNWIQGATHDQLSWVLMDLVARDWSEGRIVAWLGKIGQEIGAPRWRPRFPHRVIAAALRRKDEADTRQAHHGADPDAARATTAPNAAFGAAREIVRANGDRVQARITPRDTTGAQSWAYGEHDTSDLTQDDRAHQLAAGLVEPELILSCARILGRDGAVDLYGEAAANLLDKHAEFDAVGFGRLAGLTA